MLGYVLAKYVKSINEGGPVGDGGHTHCIANCTVLISKLI